MQERFAIRTLVKGLHAARSSREAVSPEVFGLLMAPAAVLPAATTRHALLRATQPALVELCRDRPLTTGTGQAAGLLAQLQGGRRRARSLDALTRSARPVNGWGRC